MNSTICYTCGSENTKLDMHCMTCSGFLKPCDVDGCQTCHDMERNDATCILCDLEGVTTETAPQLVFAWKCEHSCCIDHLIGMIKAYNGRLGACSMCRKDAMFYNIWIPKADTTDDETFARELMEQEQRHMRQHVQHVAALNEQDEQVVQRLLREEEEEIMANQRDVIIAQRLQEEMMQHERMLLDDFNLARQLQERDEEIHLAIQDDEEFARMLLNEED